MTLHTQHRRISPRTKRRYKAIRDFLKKAIGNPVRNDVKINSSIAVNVTDMKHKIVGLERQLNQVAEQCQECLSSRRGSEPTEQPLETETETISCETNASTPRNKDVKTKFLYRNHINLSRFEDENYTQSAHYKKNQVVNKSNTSSKINNKRSKHYNSNDNNWNVIKHINQTNNHSMLYSTSSCHSLITSSLIEHSVKYSDLKEDRKHAKYRKYETTAMAKDIKDKNICEHSDKGESRYNPEPYYCCSKPIKKSKYKPGVDEDFITNIINKQYRSVKYFGGMDSEISKFSAPVCRDQEFVFRDIIQEGTDLCSCCHNMKQYDKHNYNKLYDMKSICDTRLYSSKRHLKMKGHKKHQRIDVYDSTLYDLVPVKEKSSPKSRKKFAEDSLKPHKVYKEVPPSPRTQRPRLNLRAQYYTEFDDCNMVKKRHLNKPPIHKTKLQSKSEETLASELDRNIPEQNLYLKEQTNFNKLRSPALKQKNVQTQQDMSTVGSLSYQEALNINIGEATNTNLNIPQEAGLAVDKTDQALSEIKEILQNFLLEIKKENTASCEWGKSEIINSNKHLDEIQNTKDKMTTGMSNSSSNNYNVDQSFVPSPYVPSFQSPYYYPIIPMCPNHIPNGCTVPSTTYTCQACIGNQNDLAHSSQCTKNKTSETEKTSKGAPIISAIETEDMIKEIYKAVTNNPNSVMKNDEEISPKIITEKSPNFGSQNNPMMSRSVGESDKVIKHDVKVGTPRSILHSKSCEAICSRTSSVVEEQAKVAYSDTILERASIEATDSTVSSDESTYDTTTDEKPKESKFAKVLKSFGFFKKKNKDEVIEELSESESSAKIRHKPPPFRQNITNYMVHGQEFYNSPPVPPHPHYHHDIHYPPHDFYSPRQELNSRICDCNSPVPNDKYNPRKMHDLGNNHAMHCTRQMPTASPYPTSYESQYSHMDPQVPLCLKEVEVKSIATQSDKKKSFFQKWTKNEQKDVTFASDDQKNCSTQTAQEKKFDWKALQPKNLQHNLDAAKFSLKTQKELADGDINLRKAMLKKFFYKKNPFSPRNLIMKTLLGKDKASFGDPPKVYRPRMFL